MMKTKALYLFILLASTALLTSCSKSSDSSKGDGKPALNADLWGRLLQLLEIHDVTFVWVRGHAGHEYNERCDKLAVEAIKKIKENEDS